MSNGLLSIPEAAEKYSLSKFTLREWVKSESVDAVYAGRKALIKESSLRKHLGLQKSATRETQQINVSKIVAPQKSAEELLVDFLCRKAFEEADGKNEHLSALIGMAKGLRGLQCTTLGVNTDASKSLEGILRSIVSDFVRSDVLHE